MALVGGAGNVAGSNPAGVGTSLNIIGDHAYCYSGNIGANTTAVEAMKFTTGSYNFVGTFQFNMAIQDANGTATSQSLAQIEFNGLSISHLTAGMITTDSQVTCQQELIIPAYTDVVVKLYSTETQADRFITATLTGRITNA